MTIQAYAKVNLVLRVLAKRDDGFHDIETLISPISLCDSLDVEVGPGQAVDIACNEPGVPTGPENLIWRAANVFSQETKTTFSLHVTLHKRVPHGAGLGGGSSDAAATLRALNILLQTNLSDTTLIALAAKIGSDVPFFVRGQAAWCRGRGEVIQASEPLETMQLLLVKPPFPVSTADAYKGWTSNVQPMESFLHGLPLRNDLEAPVFRKFLLLPVIKSWLSDQPEVAAALMTGSGSTLFAVLRHPAPDLPDRIRAEFGETIWTHPCETLPSR